MRLSPDEFRVLRRAGTEAPWTGEYVNTKTAGVYTCRACGTQLFDAGTKFDSGSGWPSFTEPAVAEAVELRRDLSHGMSRTEVVCKHCDAHLGHVFDDGPADKGGQRYCINGCALTLEKKDS